METEYYNARAKQLLMFSAIIANGMEWFKSNLYTSLSVGMLEVRLNELLTERELNHSYEARVDIIKSFPDVVHIVLYSKDADEAVISLMLK